MNNNELVPGFDEETPRLDPSWGNVPIRWKPIGTRLIPVHNMPDCLVVRLDGELEAFSASYLSGRIRLAVTKGYKNIIFDLSNATLGDYREVLFLSTLKTTRESGGKMMISCAPKNLVEYFQMIGIYAALNFEDTVDAAILKIRDNS